MKLKRIAVYALVMVSFAFSISAKDLTGVKIYINPGHGGYNNTPGVEGDDRFVPTIPFPDESEAGFWESKCNLVKGLELKRMLEAAGATVMMSRTTNTVADDKSLTVIDNEANDFGANAFISIHSNGLGGNNTGTNYFLNIYNADYNDMNEPYGYGYIGKSETLINECIEMATQSAEYFKNNNLTTWDVNNTYQVKEDMAINGYTLGVLRKLTVPGFLIEGSFHDYEPETHRLLNEDYAKLTAWDLFRFYCDYFEADKPAVGVIAGSVKDGKEEMTHEYFNNWKSGTHDRLQPINDATITLKNNAGEVVKIYTTDQYHNGVFVFWDLTPGTYTVVMEAEGYPVTTKEVNVTAGETTSFVQELKKEIIPNIVATSLRGEHNGGYYDISFVLNANPTSIAINIYSEDDVLLKTINPEGDFKKGLNTVSIDLNELLDCTGNSLKWSIVAKALGSDTWRCISAIASGAGSVPEDQLMGYPNAIVVDNNPNSDYYGRIYVLNGTNVYSGGRSLDVGVYAYDPVNFTMINENAIPYTGNVNWSGKVGVSKNYVCLSPHTMAIDDDGNVYLSDWTDGNSGVWIMDPANPTDDFIPVFEVGTSDAGKVYNDKGEYVHGSISGICVVGTGKNRVLYTVDEDYSGGTAILKYNIGEISNLPYTGTPEVVYLLSNTSDLDTSLNSYLAPDRKGGFWFAQRNSTKTTGSPYYGGFSLLHFTKNGLDEGLGLVTDYYSRTDKSSSINTLGLATNLDGSRLAIGVYAAIGMKKVEFNSDGTIVASTFKDVSSEYISGYDSNLVKTSGNYMNHMTWGVAFDAADNVYVADWSDYFQAYSLAKENNEFETKAVDKIDMTVVGVKDINNDKIGVTKDGSIISISSNAELKRVEVYNLSGVKIYDAKVTGNSHKIDVNSWTNGIYMVKSGDTIVKIVK